MPLTNRILLVDDDEEFLRLFADRMSHMGFLIETARGGGEALELLGRTSYDAVIVDVLMPDMDGLETLKRIKGAYPSTEVLLLTEHGSVETALRGMKGGAFDYFIKPCDHHHVTERLKRIQEKREIEENEED